MIEFIRDPREYDSMWAYDMYVDGDKTFAWIAWNKLGTWQFRGDGPDFKSPVRSTRAEAEADAVAWWTERRLKEMR